MSTAVRKAFFGMVLVACLNKSARQETGIQSGALLTVSAVEREEERSKDASLPEWLSCIDLSSPESRTKWVCSFRLIVLHMGFTNRQFLKLWQGALHSI